MSRGTAVPLSPRTTTGPEWFGTGNADSLLLSTPTGAYTLVPTIT